jgi:hypothetical protein
MKSALEFYNLNKSLNSSLPALPHGLHSDYEIANWLLNKSNFGWLELDLNIDIQAWKKEFEACKSSLVPHRENSSSGWNSACIHGINVESTGAWTNYGYTTEQDVPYNWTDISTLTPNIKNFWNNFPYDSYRRIRFMEVEPNGYINPHSDMPGRLPGEENFDALSFGVPINVAIIHPTDCFMSLEKFGCVPFVEGKAFIINIRNYHSVINFSSTPRIHLIAHGKLDKKVNEFTELVARSYKKSYEHNKI